MSRRHHAVCTRGFSNRASSRWCNPSTRMWIRSDLCTGRWPVRIFAVAWMFDRVEVAPCHQRIRPASLLWCVAVESLGANRSSCNFRPPKVASAIMAAVGDRRDVLIEAHVEIVSGCLCTRTACNYVWTVHLSHSWRRVPFMLHNGFCSSIGLFDLGITTLTTRLDGRLHQVPAFCTGNCCRVYNSSGVHVTLLLIVSLNRV